MVPSSVRVEAGWDRSQAGSAVLNRFRVQDHPLDRATADVAASIVAATGVSVADAHLGAAVRSLPSAEIVVLSSDPADMAVGCIEELHLRVAEDAVQRPVVSLRIIRDRPDHRMGGPEGITSVITRRWRAPGQ